MPTAVSTTQTTGTFVARQPIFDRERRLFGYELLVHTDETFADTPLDPTRAAARVIVDAVVAIGLDTLVGDRLAFVNVTREMLVDDLPAVLPKDRVVLQLGADVGADEEALACCRQLVAAGFAIALDDVVLTADAEPLMALARYLKVDFQVARTAELRQYIGAVQRPGGPHLIAKGIETPADFQAAGGEGFAYLEGFFLGHPVIMPGKPIDAGALGRMRVLHALHNPLLSVAQIEELIKPDTTICYQVLKTVNSAAFAQRRTVHSIHEALLLLGRDMIRRWISVWTLAGLGRQVHPELITTSAVRARCCELLGEVAGGPSLGSEAFLVGLCSMLDAVLGVPMDDVIHAVPLSEESKAALLGADNRLRWLVDCVVAYQRGDWNRCVVQASRLGLTPQDLSTAHVAAMKWARELQRADAPRQS